MNTNHETIRQTPDTATEHAPTIEHSVEAPHQRAEQVGEQQPERHEQSKEQAQAEALENAVSVEKTTSGKEHTPSPATRRGSISKHDLTANYSRTMTHVQSELTPTSRAFSKVIHQKAVERTSDALGATIARPNAILAGAIAAFVVTLGMYLIAKNFGYQLSGFETMGGFILGWIIGLLFDYCKVMITGKRS